MAHYSSQKHVIMHRFIAIFTILILFTSTNASNLTYDDVCVNQSVYSPFKKWPASLLEAAGPTENLACWYWAECVISKANEVRKAQFAATSFVLGVVPLILKDIDWPERRLVFVPSPLNLIIEVIVRALGVVPIVESNAKLVYLPRRFSRKGLGSLTLLLLTFGVGLAYAALILVEYFSKRSSLGCPYPLFICTWFILALVPASVRTYIPGMCLIKTMLPSYLREIV